MSQFEDAMCQFLRKEAYLHLQYEEPGSIYLPSAQDWQDCKRYQYYVVPSHSTSLLAATNKALRQITHFHPTRLYLGQEKEMVEYIAKHRLRVSSCTIMMFQPDRSILDMGAKETMMLLETVAPRLEKLYFTCGGDFKTHAPMEEVWRMLRNIVFPAMEHSILILNTALIRRGDTIEPFIISKEMFPATALVDIYRSSVRPYGPVKVDSHFAVRPYGPVKFDSHFSVHMHEYCPGCIKMPYNPVMEKVYQLFGHYYSHGDEERVQDEENEEDEEDEEDESEG
jgi:hypothetical protein